MTRKASIITNYSRNVPPVNELAEAVAQRISSLRKERGLTFDALARRAGVSKGTLVQIEQERANPSIATLCRLASALGVSVSDLVAAAGETPAPVSIRGASAARTMWRGPRGGSAVLLAGTSGPDMLELWRWELRQKERFESRRHGRGTRELIHVTNGRLALEVKGEVSVIAAGASAIAATDQPHAYRNPGRSPVRFFMIVHEPATFS